MVDISVCLPAIRKDNWKKLYDSIAESVGDHSFEMVLCGPYDTLPDELADCDNIVSIQDFGPPTRCQQQAILAANGEYITWTSDDGWFYKDALGWCLDQLKEKDHKTVIVTRYVEAGSDGLGDPHMYFVNSHDPIRSPYVPKSALVFNSCILTKQLFEELGGFDCRFEACPIAFVDFSVRATKYGVDALLIEAIFECTQFPGTSGDHAPIHYGQLENDQPLYGQIWNDPSAMTRIKIDPGNWKDAPEIWLRRFNDDKTFKA